MSFADRMDRAQEEYDHELWEAHEKGEHKDNLDHDCAQCYRELREARDDQPEFQPGVFR